MIFIYALIAFNVCHFLGDFVFVNDSMLSAKKIGSPISPILAHSAVHAFFNDWGLSFCQSESFFYYLSAPVFNTFFNRFIERKIKLLVPVAFIPSK